MLGSFLIASATHKQWPTWSEHVTEVILDVTHVNK